MALTIKSLYKNQLGNTEADLYGPGAGKAAIVKSIRCVNTGSAPVAVNFFVKRALEEDPENARHVFYLAQSYRDVGNLAQAMEWYEKRANLGGWDEEKITLRFWIVGILAGLLGVTLFLASINALA